jgi:hypothetical protein
VLGFFSHKTLGILVLRVLPRLQWLEKKWVGIEMIVVSLECNALLMDIEFNICFTSG